MSVDENVRKLDAAIEGVNSHDLDKFVAVMAPSVVWKGVNPPEPMKGRDAARERIQSMLSSFPDLRVRKERGFGQGDWVCLEAVFTGTHTRPLPGPGGREVPATHKTIRVPMAFIAKFEGGEITEINSYWDQVGLMSQLGLKP